MKPAFRDKRYSGPALHVDLMDTMHETRRWSKSQFAIDAALTGRQQGGVQVGSRLAGIFTFEGQKNHGMFEATIGKPDFDNDLLVVNFDWVNEPGAKLLRTMDGQRRPEESGEQPTMRVNFTQSTANWSFSGFLLGNYHGALKSGDRFRGMIWMDKSQDPGLFRGRAIRLDERRHTLSVQFDSLSTDTFSLLETAIPKSCVASAKPPAQSLSQKIA